MSSVLTGVCAFRMAHRTLKLRPAGMKSLCGENEILHVTKNSSECLDVLTAEATSSWHDSLISKHGYWMDLFGSFQFMIFSSADTSNQMTLSVCILVIWVKMTRSWRNTALRSLDPRWINNGLKKINKQRECWGTCSGRQPQPRHIKHYSLWHIQYTVTLTHTHTHTVRCSIQSVTWTRSCPPLQMLLLQIATAVSAAAATPSHHNSMHVACSVLI